MYDEWTGTENGFENLNGGAWHYLKLGVERTGLQNKEALEKISGSFRLWYKIGTFGALVRDE